ncbi:hypothetical protein ACFL08_00655 [Patescibacteria group bacterium]
MSSLQDALLKTKLADQHQLARHENWSKFEQAEKAKKGQSKNNSSTIEELKKAKTVTAFKSSAKSLLLKDANKISIVETMQVIINVAHKNFPNNQRLKAMTLKLRNGLEKVKPEFTEKLIKRFFSKKTRWDIPGEWLK